MDLVLGTAQFGQQYGITNKSENYNDLRELELILSEFQESGFSKIDTAQNYGLSEKMLGEIGVKDFKITSKISFPESSSNFTQEVIKKIETSLQNLKLESLECLLAHNPSYLIDHPDESISLIETLKEEGLIRNFGVSVYEPSDLQNIKLIDTIQFPCNFFDRRFIDDVFNQDHEHILKQARSIFLQGLLLESADKIPNKFLKYKDIFSRYQNIYSSQHDKLKGCISFILSQNFDEFLVGVSSHNELKGILASINDYSPSSIINNDFGINVDDVTNLIDPRFWSQA